MSDLLPDNYSGLLREIKTRIPKAQYVAREEGENPSIGMILCKTKDRTIVEYALRESNKPIGVAQYRVVTKLPADLKGQFPDPGQIAKLLEHV